MLFPLRFSHLFRFSEQVKSNNLIEKGKNLMNPLNNDSIAFGYYFPKQWNVEKIYNVLDPGRKQIDSIKIIENKIGKSSGKILFTFKNSILMKKYIERYNEDFIQTQDSVHRIVIKQYELAKQSKKQQKKQINKKFGVNLTNLDFDIDYDELQRLAEDFGEIQHIDLPMKNQQLNKGAAKVYFKNKQSSKQFSEFANGLLYKQRKLKCSIIKSQIQISKDKNIKFKEQPKIFMKWNQQLYKKMIRQSVSQKQNQEKVI